MKYLYFIIPVLFPILTFAQTDTTKNISSSFIPIDSLLHLVEKEQNVRFFYEEKWLEGKTLQYELTKLPLDELISQLSTQTNLTIKQLENDYFVFMPKFIDRNTETQNSYELTVGDLLYYGSQSKAIVSGTIRDMKSKQKLSGVKINFPALNKTIASDENGNFLVTLPVGEQIVKISFSGYDDTQKKLRIVSNGNITIDIVEKSININEVTITSYRIDNNFRRTQMSVIHFDAKTVKELPLSLGERDIIKSLSLLPGIQTSGEFGTGFNVRGGNASQNLILLENIPLFTTSHLFGLTSLVNSDIVTDATFYKGGIPAIFGERTSSVLKISVGNEDVKKVSVKGGISLLYSRLSIELPLSKKINFLLGGRLSSYSNWLLKKMPDDDLMNSSAGFYDVNSKITYAINESSRLSAFFYMSNDNFSIFGTQNYKYTNILGNIHFTKRFSSKFFTEINAGISSFKSYVSEDDTLKPTEAYKIENSIVYKTLKNSYVYEINSKHVVSAGFNAVLYDISPGKFYPLYEESILSKKAIQKEKGFESAIFLSDDYKLNERSSVEIGLRFSEFSFLGPSTVYFYSSTSTKTVKSIEDSTKYGSGKFIKNYFGFEPRLSFRYNFTSNSSIRISYNRIFQYINQLSNTTVISPTDIWKLSDIYTKPLICNQFAVGLFSNKSDNSFETSVELYYKALKNLVDYKNGAILQLNKYLETELIPVKGHSFGVEFYAKKNKGKLTGWISYTFSRSFRKSFGSFSEEKINNNKLYPDYFDRPHNLTVNAGYYITKRWRCALTFNYNTGRPTTLPELKYQINGYQVVSYSERNKYRIPDYHRLDLSLSYFENLRKKKSWKTYWTISVLNIYARRNAYSVYYRHEISPYDYLQDRYVIYKLYIIGKPFPTITYNFIF